MFPILIKGIISIKSALCRGNYRYNGHTHYTPDALVIQYCYTDTDFEDFFSPRMMIFFNFPDSFFHENNGHFLL